MKLRAVVLVLTCLSASFCFAQSKDQSIFFNVNDPAAKTNPVRKVDATKLSVDAAMAKLGKVKLSQTISLICNGYNPKASYLPLAFDLVVTGKPTEIMALVEGSSQVAKLCEIKQAAIK